MKTLFSSILFDYLRIHFFTIMIPDYDRYLNMNTVHTDFSLEQYVLETLVMVLNQSNLY